MDSDLGVLVIALSSFHLKRLLSFGLCTWLILSPNTSDANFCGYLFAPPHFYMANGRQIPLPELVKEAKKFAREWHKGQKRKFDGKPYFTHPARVAKRLMEHTKDPEMVAAAFLHDVIEDTPASRYLIGSLFGERVARLVSELTSDKEKIEEMGSKAEYLAWKMERMSLDALLIKLADRLDNVSDFESAEWSFIRKYRVETNYVLSIVGQRQDLTYSHQKLIQDIYRAMSEGETLFRVKEFARDKYGDLERKLSEEDYFIHPMRVVGILSKLEVSLEVKTAAYLKDVLEKGTGTTYVEIRERFGVVVADLVLELTVNYVERKQFPNRSSYMVERLNKLSENALLIMMAGRVDNLSEIRQLGSPQIFREYVMESKSLLQALTSREASLSENHKTLLKQIKDLLAE